MTEDEYIILSNMVKIDAALAILCDILPGYGISDDEYRSFSVPLTTVRDKMNSLVVIDKEKE